MKSPRMKWSNMGKDLNSYIGGKYQPLTEKDIKAVHAGSLKLLSNTGFLIKSQRALDILDSKGANVDHEKRLVKIPPAMVEDAIASAPSEVRLFGRDDENELFLEGRTVHLGTGGTCLNVLDLQTGQSRQTTLKDIGDIAKLVDTLDNLHFFVIPVHPTDIEKEDVDVNRFYAALSNTSKHVSGGTYTVEGTRNVIRMGQILAGGAEQLKERPLISLFTCTMSPLTTDEVAVEMLIEIASSGVPLICPSEPMGGSTAPVTLAGILNLANTESLMGVILSQAVNRGTPVLFGGAATISDMRTMNYLAGTIEMGLIQAGSAQMGQYYKIPSFGTGGLSDSKIPDVQAGYEKASVALTVALAGGNYIHDAAGQLESAMTVAYEQYVIDNDIIGTVLRAVKGIVVNEETLAVDVIDKVGPGGNFLAEAHTLKHMRSEYFSPRVSDRGTREQWEGDGALDGRERARRIARETLATHRPLAIPDVMNTKIKNEMPAIRA
ncbi:MAG TPA: trimethylamine methyltransferase [Phycisphaerae bacterium]|nr:trimethylamine methyltransferase [Phycisphaerae bacterium]